MRFNFARRLAHCFGISKKQQTNKCFSAFGNWRHTFSETFGKTRRSNLIVDNSMFVSNKRSIGCVSTNSLRSVCANCFGNCSTKHAFTHTTRTHGHKLVSVANAFCDACATQMLRRMDGTGRITEDLDAIMDKLANIMPLHRCSQRETWCGFRECHYSLNMFRGERKFLESSG